MTLLWKIEKANLFAHHISLVILVNTSIYFYMQNLTRLTPGLYSSFTHLHLIFCCYPSAEGEIDKNIQRERERVLICFFHYILFWFDVFLKKISFINFFFLKEIYIWVFYWGPFFIRWAVQNSDLCERIKIEILVSEAI